MDIKISNGQEREITISSSDLTSIIYQLRPEAIKGEAPKLRKELKNLQSQLAKLLG